MLGSSGVFYGDGSYLQMWKAKENSSHPTMSDLAEIKDVFPKTSLWEKSNTYDEEGWRFPGRRNIATVQSIIDALDNDTEPTGSGDNGRKVLEIAIAMRESHRQGHIPVRLPLQNRSLRIFPHKGRWLNKKEVYGKEWYSDAINNQKQ